EDLRVIPEDAESDVAASTEDASGNLRAVRVVGGSPMVDVAETNCAAELLLDQQGVEQFLAESSPSLSVRSPFVRVSPTMIATPPSAVLAAPIVVEGGERLTLSTLRTPFGRCGRRHDPSFRATSDCALASAS